MLVNVNHHPISKKKKRAGRNGKEKNVFFHDTDSRYNVMGEEKEEKEDLGIKTRTNVTKAKLLPLNLALI